MYQCGDQGSAPPYIWDGTYISRTHFSRTKMTPTPDYDSFMSTSLNKNIPILIDIYLTVVIWNLNDYKSAFVEIATLVPKQLCQAVMKQFPNAVTWWKRIDWIKQMNILRQTQNGHHFCIRYFQINFLVWKMVYFDSNATFSQLPNQQ